MPRKNNDLAIALTIIGIFVTIIGIIVAILIANGFFDKPKVSISGHLIGSDLITKSQPEFGLGFRNDGEEWGRVTVEVSSNNENVSFVEEEITKPIPVTKDVYDIQKVEFSLNKSVFEKQIGNFTITINIFYGNKRDIIIWEYAEDCIYGHDACMYRWKK